MHIGSYRAIRTSDMWVYRYNLKLDGVSGFEPENADIKDRCRNHLAIPQKVEREKGFEPTRDRFVDDQSTTWPTILWFPRNLKIGDGMEI